MAQMLDPEAPEGANEIRSPSFSKVSAVGVKVAISPAPALATGMVKALPLTAEPFTATATEQSAVVMVPLVTASMRAIPAGPVGRHDCGVADGGSAGADRGTRSKKPVLWPGQSKILPERLAFVFAPENSPPLQFRHHAIGKIIKPTREVRKLYRKTIGTPGREPFLHLVCD